jgi:flagellin-like hook-associated protein FlgL
LTANQVQNVFGTGTEVYAFSENGTENAEEISINFNKGDGTISANVPVLVKATQASTEQVFQGVQVVAPTADVKVAGTNASFVGVYGPETIGEGHFFIGNGALYKSPGTTSIKAFRAYIQLKNPNVTPASIKLFIDDIETAISEINGIEAENGTIYNLAGQRINKMQKGINIVNGKKIMK